MVTTSDEPQANEPVHRFIETNGIRMHVVEQGRGPTVLLCHGFPESWYSWRHQLTSLAAAGFNVVAPDMRGYGQTDRPESIDQYSLLHLIGDLIGLLDALGKETAVVVGHDWGAPVAWYSALLRPDRFRGVAGLSVPFMPRGAVHPSKTFPETADAIFYQSYFQVPGVAEAELEKDVHRTISSFLYNASGDAPRHTAGPSSEPAYMVPRNGGMLTTRVAPSSLPSWITEKDIDVYVRQFEATGFRGGLNWYRNIDRNWELFAPFAGAKITVPALFVAGDRDLVLSFPGTEQILATLPNRVPHLRKTLILPGCGHWTQQERPAEVNEALIQFLKEVPRR
jgi:pimeloyl-ACP methyl ester carboxylesterase